MRFLAIFSSLVRQINLILHILITLNGLNNLADIWLMLDHSKVTKMHFWMIQSAKKQVFGRFLDLGLLDRLDIAYFDRTVCFPTLGNTTRLRRCSQKLQKGIFEWFKVAKSGFLDLGLLDWLVGFGTENMVGFNSGRGVVTGLWPRSCSRELHL